ncbi:ABC transporter ATP-binding protein [Ectobacillus antri]|uniref:ABC transporter ATP-binding protein n=1 Tax=Ectobacillus antri TaxID=2486280 RepID=A0ABT6H162_9BACI|nr:MULTISPECIES: ABC transporter ATP-binding protein [Ectobacillus]MDG4656327.1 ABC transporter ATP-binding protein [Ectobacillus antri]MDG5753002.1 ABC transporter ATP-binding protein [Ectobacillus antri]UOY92838.1 ABC transporter ATP-binding protein [Ectobacillus sp. JY-23]
MFITAEHIRKSYGEQLVLQDVSFAVKEGETVGLLGPNGSGKTTIIRLLNGVIDADGGSILVGNWNPVTNGHEIRRMSGILTESAGLYYELSGLENLKFFAKLYGMYDERRIQMLLEEFQLANHQHKKVGTYSTGMKRRLGMIKSILHRPSLLFLDEPTNGLDPEGIQLVMQYIRRLSKEEGTTILICSHILHQMETVCDTYLFLEQGRILESGTKSELEARHVQQISVKVETGLAGSGQYAGYSYERVNHETVRFELPSKDAITNLLAALTKETWVHQVEIENRDLESLYFAIRRGKHE